MDYARAKDCMGGMGRSAKIRRCSILIAITCLPVVALLAVAQLPDYGKLSHIDVSGMKAGPAVGALQQLLPTPEFRASAGLSAVVISGSQTLERDILSGTVFLLDDAFPKGENIDVGNVKGTVEKVSLRSFQLSHHLGMLHTIPFGEIQHLTKFSSDWVMMKLPLRLTYDTDIRREGVRFAHREVTVRARSLPNDRELDRDEQKMVGAARNALDAVEAERPKKPVPGGQWMTAEQGRRDAGASDG